MRCAVASVSYNMFGSRLHLCCESAEKSTLCWKRIMLFFSLCNIHLNFSLILLNTSSHPGDINLVLRSLNHKHSKSDFSGADDENSCGGRDTSLLPHLC